ncbi:hypothetical protein PIB30_052766 [Stylosanthes scabra]|uniref:Uncharacterized protein n=1 Tax=Stylosanthes scabra TaxID=79078 RepID=A0ABU6ZH44_9FABA|nr:hypothetical protein [Stylosanthes scabra]
MARKSVIHVIIIVLIIGIVICSAKMEFEKGIIGRPWATTLFYHITSSQIEECIKECEQRLRSNPEKMRHCMLECVIVECMGRYRKDKNKRDACIEQLYAMYQK